MSRNDGWRDDEGSKYMRFTPEEEALSDEELDAEIAYLKKSLYDWHFRVFLSPQEYANVYWNDEVTTAQFYANCLAREAERERQKGFTSGVESRNQTCSGHRNAFIA